MVRIRKYGTPTHLGEMPLEKKEDRKRDNARLMLKSSENVRKTNQSCHRPERVNSLLAVKEREP